MRKKLAHTAADMLFTDFSPSKPTGAISFEFDSGGKKVWKKYRRWLNASEDFDVNDGYVTFKGGAAFPGMARWFCMLSFNLQGHVFRYRILLMKYLNREIGFAIHNPELPKLKHLPGIDLSDQEIKMLLNMANQMSGVIPEIVVKYPNYAKKQADTTAKSSNDYDENALLHLLHSDLVRESFLVGVLANLQAFCDPIFHAPFPVSLLIPPGVAGLSFPQTISPVLRASDLAAQEAQYGCRELQVKERRDLVTWECRHERITVLRYSDETLIRPIWREAEQSALLERQTRYPALPILLGRSSLPPAVSYEVKLSQEGIASPLMTCISSALRPSTCGPGKRHWRRA